MQERTWHSGHKGQLMPRCKTSGRGLGSPQSQGVPLGSVPWCSGGLLGPELIRQCQLHNHNVIMKFTVGGLGSEWIRIRSLRGGLCESCYDINETHADVHILSCAMGCLCHREHPHHGPNLHGSVCLISDCVPLQP